MHETQCIIFEQRNINVQQQKATKRNSVSYLTADNIKSFQLHLNFEQRRTRDGGDAFHQ